MTMDSGTEQEIRMPRIPRPHPGIMGVLLPVVILLLVLIALDPVRAVTLQG